MTENFLDEQVWKELKIGHLKLKWPLIIHNVDSTENCLGKITHCCWLKIYYQHQFLRMHLFLTDLGQDHFILGYPFLFTFYPEVDWRAAKLKGGTVRLEMTGFQCAQNRVERCQAVVQSCVGTLKEGKEIWVRKLTTAQQWAH
jgi:hypothetical protein